MSLQIAPFSFLKFEFPLNYLLLLTSRITTVLTFPYYYESRRKKTLAVNAPLLFLFTHIINKQTNISRFCTSFDRIILSRVKPKTLKLVSAVKRSAIKCSAEDEMNREYKYVSEFLDKT